MYYLERTHDGTGSAGGLSLAMWNDQSGDVACELDARPRVGVILCVGDAFEMAGRVRCKARQTSYITKILSDEPRRVVFETVSGSVYVWRVAMQ